MASLTTSISGVGVAAISRAMRVIEVFADRPKGVALTRLSAELGYGKATLSKVLATMERGRFVRRDTVTGHFHLSCRLLALAFAYAERVGIPGLCAPILQALADETGELVQLAVVEGGSVLFVAKAEGPDQRMRMVRSEEHTSELQSRFDLVCRLLLEKKKNNEMISSSFSCLHHSTNRYTYHSHKTPTPISISTHLRCTP